MIKLNMFGNVFGLDGYSNHTRHLFNALYKQKNLDIKIHTQLPPNWNLMCNDAELDCVIKPERKEDWNLIVAIPQMWKLFIGLGKNIGYCVWEGDKVPLSWIDEFLNPKIDLIFVPSEHTKQAIKNTMEGWDAGNDRNEVFDKIKIIPHGVNRDIFKNLNTEKKDDTFKFLCSKGWRGTNWDRGGVQYLLQAYAEEFKKEEKVQLTLKLNPSYIKPEMIQQSLDALKLKEPVPTIHINCDAATLEQLNTLYNSADCFVCPTRAESFNLPGLEAMSCGLPTIQTRYGGQVDYMNDKNSLFIDYELSMSEEKQMYEGVQWATPKIEDIRKKMRWAFENQDKIKEMGKQAEEDSKNWTWDKSAELISSLIKA